MKKLTKMLMFLQMLLIGILLLMLFGCRSKKITSEKEKTVKIDTVTVVETQTDTIFWDRLIEKTAPVSYETEIENPCDSFGNLKPINTQIGSGNNRAWIYSKDGKLFIGQYLDSVQNVSENTYIARWRQDSIDLRKSFLKETEKESKTVKIVWPWWVYAFIIYAVLSTALNIYQKFTPRITHNS